MLEKRSREFGIYLLIGMNKKEVSGLYMKENLLLGMCSFVMGLGLGMLLQQVLLVVLYSVIQVELRPHLEFNGYCFLMTVCCFAGCYLLALFRCSRKFRKMNIHDLMRENQKNEELKEKNEKIKRLLLPFSILFIFAFGVWILSGNIQSPGGAAVFLTGLFITMYVFYTGLSAWIICYVKKKGNAVYRGQNLFLLRQFASKLKTMRFTMGTLTVLFMVALLGCSVALMFTDWQNQVLEMKFPFDVQVNSQNTHLRYFGDEYRRGDGTPDEKKIRKSSDDDAYCRYDTYMGLSDYNHLRKMLGYSPETLGKNEYILQMKQRVYKETGDFTDDVKIQDNGETLTCRKICTESFSQDGHNGGDYIIVVSDERIR